MSYYPMQGYGAFGADAPGFDPEVLAKDWAAWVITCKPVKNVSPCQDPVKIASVKIVQTALNKAGFSVGADGADGVWGPASRSAWAKFAAANPGVTPSGDAYEVFTLKDFQTLANKAYGLPVGESGPGGSAKKKTAAVAGESDNTPVLLAIGAALLLGGAFLYVQKRKGPAAAKAVKNPRRRRHRRRH